MSICQGVNFTEIAREWRCKWSEDGDKAALVALQQTLDAHLSALKSVEGSVRVQRVVCGGCRVRHPGSVAGGDTDLHHCRHVM
jgi:hypothetical protein